MKFFSTVKKYSWILAALPLAVSTVSCSENAMDEINKDINHAPDAQAKFLLADLITRSSFSNTGGDINTYTSIYVEHEVGTHNQMYRAEMRSGEPSLSTTFNNPWGSIYMTLKNAKIVIAKCSEGGSQAGNDVTKGMAEVIAAYNLALLTDMFGDAPYTEALTIANKTPNLDKQELLYQEVLAFLDQAIIDLQSSDRHSSGGPNDYDLLYQGSKAKWLKFAYGLKARYTMRLIQRTADQSAALAQVISYANQSFTSAAEQAAFKIYDASNLNPLFDFQWSRDGLAASQSMADKLIARQDPRARRVFVGADWTQVDDLATNKLQAPNGANEEQQFKYNTSAFVYAQTAPTLLLSYHEVLFLKAEAMARLGQDAKATLKQAVMAGIANAEVNVKAALSAPTVLSYGGLEETSTAISPEEAALYFDQQVQPLYQANALKEIANQKYIAFFGASGESTEAYNDIRRYQAMNANYIHLANTNKFPLRLPYGNDDTSNNPFVKAAFGDGQYVYSEAVWWAGGNR